MASPKALLGSVTKQRLGLNPNVIALSPIITLIYLWNNKLNNRKFLTGRQRNLFASASSTVPEKQSHPGYVPLSNGRLWPSTLLEGKGKKNVQVGVELCFPQSRISYIPQLWPGRYFLLRHLQQPNLFLTLSKTACFMLASWTTSSDPSSDHSESTHTS